VTRPDHLDIRGVRGRSQHLSIDASGPDVPLFAPKRLAGDPSPEDAIPDPVELFVRAVNEQMFPRPDDRACRSSATLVDRDTVISRSVRRPGRAGALARRFGDRLYRERLRRRGAHARSRGARPKAARAELRAEGSRQSGPRAFVAPDVSAKGTCSSSRRTTE
jgi:hypothetical protein